MFGIAYPGSRRLLWRSAIQAFIAEDIALAEQQKRLQQIVVSLLSNLPDQFEVFKDASEVIPIADRHPEYHELMAKVIRPYHDITEQALKNEQS